MIIHVYHDLVTQLFNNILYRPRSSSLRKTDFLIRNQRQRISLSNSQVENLQRRLEEGRERLQQFRRDLRVSGVSGRLFFARETGLGQPPNQIIYIYNIFMKQVAKRNTLNPCQSSYICWCFVSFCAGVCGIRRPLYSSRSTQMFGFVCGTCLGIPIDFSVIAR